MKTLDKVLIIVGVFAALFTLAMIIIFCIMGAVPDTLIGCVFAACGFEGGVCGWIKNTKERAENRRWERQDRKEQNNGI